MIYIGGVQNRLTLFSSVTFLNINGVFETELGLFRFNLHVFPGRLRNIKTPTHIIVNG